MFFFHNFKCLKQNKELNVITKKNKKVFDKAYKSNLSLDFCKTYNIKDF